MGRAEARATPDIEEYGIEIERGNYKERAERRNSLGKKRK